MMASYPAASVEAPLLQALEDEDSGVRAEAASSAGRVRMTSAVPLLLDWLEDTHADVRRSAVMALGLIGEPRSVGPLVRALGDANADVRRASVSALASIGGDEVVVPIIARLDDDEPEVRVTAAQELGRLDDARAVVPLIGRGRDEVPAVRAAVNRALGRLGEARAAGALVQALEDSNADVQLAAIAALGQIGSARAIDPLVASSRLSDPRLARASVAALAAIDDERARAAVVQALASPMVLETAREALVASARQDRALPLTLAAALSSATSDGHTTAIVDTLRQTMTFPAEPTVVDALLETLRASRGALSQVLLTLGVSGDERVLVPLLERLATPATRAPVLGALSAYFAARPEPDGRVADPLLEVLSEVAPRLRPLVVELIGHSGAERALPTLRPLLEHDDAALRRASLIAIGEIGDPAGAEAAFSLLDDPDGRTRFEAARAVGQSASPDTLEALVDRLERREPTDRHAVLIALGGAMHKLRDQDAGIARAVGALETAVRSADHAIVARALDALRVWRGARAAEVLASLAVNAPTLRARRLATFSLGAFESEDAVRVLREALDDPERRVAAAAALGEHGDAEDVARLVAAADAPWPSAAAASFSLARLARRGTLTDGTPLCALTSRRDPYVRANLAIVFAVTETRCPDLPASRWLTSDAPAVRAAAARWVAATDPRADAVLAEQARIDLAGDVVAACVDPSLPALDDEADVYLYRLDGRSLLRDRFGALRFADGTVLVVRADFNAHVRVENAARGAMLLEDPITTPLER